MRLASARGWRTGVTVPWRGDLNDASAERGGRRRGPGQGESRRSPSRPLGGFGMFWSGSSWSRSGLGLRVGSWMGSVRPTGSSSPVSRDSLSLSGFQLFPVDFSINSCAVWPLATTTRSLPPSPWPRSCPCPDGLPRPCFVRVPFVELKAPRGFGSYSCGLSWASWLPGTDMRYEERHDWPFMMGTGRRSSAVSPPS
jgi:hypothetical protein